MAEQGRFRSVSQAVSSLTPEFKRDFRPEIEKIKAGKSDIEKFKILAGLGALGLQSLGYNAEEIEKTLDKLNGTIL